MLGCHEISDFNIVARHDIFLRSWRAVKDFRHIGQLSRFCKLVCCRICKSINGTAYRNEGVDMRILMLSWEYPPRIVGGIHSDVQGYIGSVEQKLTEFSSRVIVNSLSMQEEVIRLFHLDTDRLNVIPNGIDLHKFDHVPVDMDLRRTHAKDDEHIVFFVGRFTYEKGVHILMDAVPKVLARIPDVKFVIAGRGQESNSLRQRAWNMGVAHRVESYRLGGFAEGTVRTGTIRTGTIKTETIWKTYENKPHVRSWRKEKEWQKRTGTN